MNNSRKPRQSKPPASPPPRKSYPLIVREGDTPAQHGEHVGAQATAPELAACRAIVAAEGKSPFGDAIDLPGMIDALRAHARAVNGGDLDRVEAMLQGQATALQSLFVRLLERGMAETMLPQFEAHMRLALKAQSQSRATLETLAAVRHGPPVFARQANLSGSGPMQVNNGLPSLADARQTQIPPTRLLEPPNGERMDTGTSCEAGASDPSLEALGAQHRAEDN